MSSPCNDAGDFLHVPTKPYSISEKVANLTSLRNENNLRIRIDNDNTGKFPHSATVENRSDELEMLLIQKECEIVCLRSELELYKKQTKDKKEFTENKTDGFLLDKDDDLDSMGFAEAASDSFSEKGEDAASQAISSSIMNSRYGRDYFDAQDTSTMEKDILQSVSLSITNLSRNPEMLARKMHENDWKVFEKEKYVLHKKELELQPEKLELKKLRERPHFNKDEICISKLKIGKELSKISDDDAFLGDKDAVEEKSEKEEISIDKYQMNDLQNTSNIPKIDQCKTKESMDDATKELTDICGNKINDLHDFMSIWKSDAEELAQETETMLHEYSKNKEIFDHSTSRSDTCHDVVNALSKEWAELRELHEDIGKQRNELISQKSELEAKATAIEEKEKILNKEKIESEKSKLILNVNWDCLQSETELLRNEKQMLVQEIESLEETKRSLEKEKNELTKVKAQYEEEMKIAEEIQKQVDERRAQAMLDQQKCLDEKWEALDNEREELKNAWNKYEKQLLALEIEKDSVSRERKELNILQENLESAKSSMEEDRNLQEEEWKTIFTKNKDLEDNMAEVKDEKKVITEEFRRLDDEKNKIKEMIESLNRRKEEIKEEEKVLEEKKLKMMNEKEELNKLKANLETEWKKTKCDKESFCKIEKCKKEKSIKSKKLEKSRNRKKIYKLSKIVSAMEKYAQLLKSMENQRFAKYPGEGGSERLDQRYQSKNLQEKVYILLEVLNNMEANALKIRMKFNEQTKYQKRMKLLRKKIKQGQIKQKGKLQEHIHITNGTYEKEVSSVLTCTSIRTNKVTAEFKDLTKCEENIGINLISSHQQERENSFTSVLGEEYLMQLTPQRANHAIERANYSVDEWKKTYMTHGDNFYTKTSKNQEICERINLNCWEKYSIENIKVAELTPNRAYNHLNGYAAVKEKPHSPNCKWRKSQCTYTGKHTCGKYHYNDKFGFPIHKAENKFKMHTPFSYKWNEESNSPACCKIRGEKCSAVSPNGILELQYLRSTQKHFFLDW